MRRSFLIRSGIRLSHAHACLLGHTRYRARHPRRGRWGRGRQGRCLYDRRCPPPRCGPSRRHRKVGDTASARRTRPRPRTPRAQKTMPGTPTSRHFRTPRVRSDAVGPQEARPTNDASSNGAATTPSDAGPRSVHARPVKQRRRSSVCSQNGSNDPTLCGFARHPLPRNQPRNPAGRCPSSVDHLRKAGTYDEVRSSRGGYQVGGGLERSRGVWTRDCSAHPEGSGGHRSHHRFATPSLPPI